MLWIEKKETCEKERRGSGRESRGEKMRKAREREGVEA
jgi:hypothetical protein